MQEVEGRGADQGDPRDAARPQPPGPHKRHRAQQDLDRDAAHGHGQRRRGAVARPQITHPAAGEQIEANPGDAGAQEVGDQTVADELVGDERQAAGGQPDERKGHRDPREPPAGAWRHAASKPRSAATGNCSRALYNRAVDDPDVTGPRDWIGEARRSAASELRHFASTAFQFTRHPVRFTQAWRGGSDEAMNPIGFMGTSAVVVGAVRQIALRVLGQSQPDSIIAAVASALGPYAHYAVLAIICHLALRLGSRRRPLMRDSVAYALYAGGGAAAASECLAWVVVLALSPLLPASATPWLVAIGLGVAFSVFCTVLSTSLSILHEARGWGMVVAFAVAFPLLGLFFGELHPPGQYGMHWVLTLWNAHGQLAPRLTLGL